MKRLIAALALILTSCVTCPTNKVVSDFLAEHLAGYGDCGGYDAIVKVLDCQMKDLAFCDADRFQDQVKEIPDGAWSASGMACYLTVKSLSKVLSNPPKDWGCRKNLDIKYLLEECGKLD